MDADSLLSHPAAALTPPFLTSIHPSLPPGPRQHSTLCRSMTVSCGFSGPAVTCVLLIYRRYSRQANPEAPSLSRQPSSSPAEAYLPLCGVSPCQVIQLYRARRKQQSISGTISDRCVSLCEAGHAFKASSTFVVSKLYSFFFHTQEWILQTISKYCNRNVPLEFLMGSRCETHSM